MSPIVPRTTVEPPRHPREDYWRSVDQFLNDPKLDEHIASEFPMLAEAIARHDRRGFLRLIAASMALAGITATGCRRWPVEELRPHASRPEGSTPGVSEHYATLFELGGVAYGVLAKSYDGRPIKMEGNPSHPDSRGAASALAQASVLNLYDPDRSRRIRFQQSSKTTADSDSRITIATSGLASRNPVDVSWQREEPAISWERFVASVQGALAGHRNRQGEGLAVLVHPSSSPTLHRMIAELRQQLPKSRWFAYEPLHRDRCWEASQSMLGQIARPQYDLTQADMLLCVDSDLLGIDPGHIKHAGDWANGRRGVDRGTMNRVATIESAWTITGGASDVRIALKPSQCEVAVAWIAHRIGVPSAIPLTTDANLQEKLDLLARDLAQAGPRGLVVGGPSLSVPCLQMIHAINDHLGNEGTSIRYTEEPLSEIAPQGYMASISKLSQMLQGNVIQTLVILGGNPVYDAPNDAPLRLESTDDRPLLTVHLSDAVNETSRRCAWHVPLAHTLESWSDGLSWSGKYTIGQPLIEPLFGGRSMIEMVGLMGGSESVDARAEVRKTFDQYFSGAGNKAWETALHDGCFGEPVLKQLNSSKVPVPQDSQIYLSSQSSLGEDILELRLQASNSVYDGRFSNNPWLQELPDPISKLTWDNAAYISKADADRWRLSNGSLIRLMDQVDVPVMIMPGQPQGCISVAVGYGRSNAGQVGNAVGVDLFDLRSSKSGMVLSDCSFKKLEGHRDLASTQMHHVVRSVADIALMQRLGSKGEAGQLIHETTLEEFVSYPSSAHGDAHAVHAAPLFDLPQSFDTPHRWAMAIDLNACIGCSGCVIVCQAENNIPVVGRDNVLANREMHWIRIDRYFKGDITDPDMVHVPTACVHCENAPCEQVCPVAATVHDTEGINAMVYNRCIGTRYCANNCPYKVRRFNYFDFHASDPREPAKPYLGIPDQQQVYEISTLKKMVHNPDVSVRMRGVMEKCTYCVQRISDARIHAKNEHAQGLRSSDIVQEGEMRTACQATCPTQAIVFGDLNDPNSEVSRLRNNSRSYEMLAELNLGARTTYLAKVRNRTP